MTKARSRPRGSFSRRRSLFSAWQGGCREPFDRRGDRGPLGTELLPDLHGHLRHRRRRRRATGSCGSAATRTTRCRTATPARRGGRCRRCTTTPTASSGRCVRVDGQLRAGDVGGVPRRPRRPAAHDHRRARSGGGRRVLRQRPRHGRRRLPDDGGAVRAIGTPAKFSPLTIDGTAKTLVSHLVGGFPGFTTHIDYERARLVLYIGVNPVVSHGHNIALSDPVTAIRAVRGARRGLGARPPAHRDRPAGDAAPRAPAGHRLRGARLPHPRAAARRRRPRRARAPHRRPATSWPAAVEPFTSSTPRTSPGSPSRGPADAARRRPARPGRSPSTPAPASRWAPGNGNVTAWLVLGADDRHRRDEPPGRRVVPSRLQPAVRRRSSCPSCRPRAIFGPGPRSRPDAQAFLGEWPCAVLPDEIRGGQHPRLPQLRRQPAHLVPRRRPSSSPRCGRSSCSSPPRSSPTPRPRSPPTSCPRRTSSSGPTSRCGTSSCRACAPSTRPPVVEPVGDRRSAWWVLAEIGRRLGHDLADPDATDDEMLARTMAPAPLQLRRGRRDRLRRGDRSSCRRRGWSSYLDRSGGWRLAPPLLVDQLAALEPPRAARPRAPPAAAQAERRPRLPRREPPR